MFGECIVYIVEKVNGKYCYASECVWDNEKKQSRTLGTCVGKLNTEDNFIPNRYLASLFQRAPSSLTEHQQNIIDAVVKKYGEAIQTSCVISKKDEIQTVLETAQAVFFGPELVFSVITKKYQLDAIIKKAFPGQTASDVLSLAWYIASEGSALVNSDAWLDSFENPRGCGMTSQEITRLLDRVSYDGMMTFYKLWPKQATGERKKGGAKVLYDLTSISYYGSAINSADWGYNRDHEKLPQVNYGLLCLRDTAMPLFAWPLTGSVSDVRTLQNMLQFMNKLGFKPDCLMMDRGFASQENITYMLRNKYTFLQALKVNADWIYKLLDIGELTRMRPDSMIKEAEKTYYVSTTPIWWTILKQKTGKNIGREEVAVFVRETRKGPAPPGGFEVISRYACSFHALFCQDLIGNQHDRFMEKLKDEYERLVSDETTKVAKELKSYFVIKRAKYARHRSVDFNMEAITRHKNKYAGYVCFLTNDMSVLSAVHALNEYSTRDYIEKDFDEMKNELDMNRIRVHTDDRMKARLFIQFIAEIYMREIRVRLHESDECRKMTRKQIFSHIKGIYKVKFKGKYKDVHPELSKSQRGILNALGIRIAY
jgi:transposase